MKKIKFVLFSALIILFIVALFACSGEVKDASKSKDAAKKITPVTKKAAPISNKPVPAATAVPVPGQNKPVPAATAIPVQDKTQPVSAANVTIASTPADAYNYNPVGKPDPFLPFIMAEILEKKKIETKEKEAVFSIFPLQRAEAERYRVVGIAGDKDHRVAVAEDTAKKFYPLLIGTRIGLHNGKVIEIMADRVIVEEIENKKAKRIILKLRKN